MRSLWKGIPLNSRLNRLYDRKKRLTAGFNHRRLFISDRALNLRRAPVIKKIIGLTFQVRTGNEFIKWKVLPNTVGYKFGSFISTKNYTGYKVKKKNK